MPTERRRSARTAAMDLLARREHSPSALAFVALRTPSLSELRDKLAAREFDSAEIEDALAALSREGLADDGRFVEAFVASRIRKGQGPIRIRAELLQRGVAAETLSQ